MKDLQESIIKVIAGPEKHSRVIPEKERRLTAYHEAGHAVVMHALPDLDPEMCIRDRLLSGLHQQGLPQ